MDKALNIVVIGPAHPFRGGIADTNEAMCRAFIKSGHRASLVTFTVQYPDLLFPGLTQYSQDPPPEDLEIHRWIHSFNPLNWPMASRKIRDLKPDVVIIRYWLPFMAPALGSIARMLPGGVKVVGITDNVVPHEKRHMDKAFTRYFMKGCDGFMALSQAVLKDIEALSNKPASYFPHPINDQLPPPISKLKARELLGLGKDDKYLLFFGFIRKYKGLDLLLQAIADERIKSHNIKLIVAGESYESMAEYERIIVTNNMADRVVLNTSFIPASDVALYFSAADLITQTYRTATQSGITQMALHYNKPVLITRVGGLEEFVVEGKTGLFSTTDPENIADQIIRFFEGEQGAYSDSIETEKKRFTWNAFVGHFIQFYNTSLKQ